MTAVNPQVANAGTTDVSPLLRMVQTTPTDYWNDSCSIEELTYGIEHGAVGATTNPSIVLTVLKKEMGLWREHIFRLIAENPTWTENDIQWKLIEDMAVRGAQLLQPVFKRYEGQKGRLSIQTNPQNYRDAEAIADRPSILTASRPTCRSRSRSPGPESRRSKEPPTPASASTRPSPSPCRRCSRSPRPWSAGSQRREAEGLDTAHMAPVCTMMIGRLDDWMQVLVKRDGIDIDPTCASWAGIAAFKKAYGIFRQRAYRTRPLAAAYRHLGHWSELIGGDLVQTMPYEWALKVNASDIPVIERMQNPVDPTIVEALSRRSRTSAGPTTRTA